MITQIIDQNPTLQNLLNGNVPDLDLPLIPNERLKGRWEAEKDQWEYIGLWFRQARQNIACVPLMPILAYLTLATNTLPPSDTALKIIQHSKLICPNIDARFYQCWTAWLRELHVGLYLAQHGTVTKNLKDDISNGVDWTYNSTVNIAIAHDGKASDYYWTKRKGGKTDAQTVVLRASASSNGLHLVSTDEIDAKVLKYSSSSSLI